MRTDNIASCTIGSQSGVLASSSPQYIQAAGSSNAVKDLFEALPVFELSHVPTRFMLSS